MDEQPRLVRYQPRPRPLLKQRKSENEEVFQCKLDEIDDLIDDSLRFIDEELSSIGLGFDQRAVLKARLCHELLSLWVRPVLDDLQDDFAGVADIDLAEKYFEKKFGYPW